MSGFTNIFKNEVADTLGNRTLIIFTVALPFVMSFFFKGFMDTGVVRDIPIAVVDYDNSASSRLLLQYLEATPQLHIAHKVASMEEAESLIRKTEVYGLVMVPKYFDRDLMLGRKPVVLNEFNQNLLVPGGLESSAVRKAVNALSLKVQSLVRLNNGGNPQRLEVALEPVRLDSHIISNPFLNYRYYFLSAFLPVFLQIFVLLTSIYVIGQDLKYQRGAQLMEMGKNHIPSIIFGKLAPYTIWFFLLGLVMFHSMATFLELPINGSRPMLLLTLLLFILSGQAYAFFLAVALPDIRSAMTMGNAIAALSLTMSGFSFPLMSMLPFFQWAGQIFPFTQFLGIFKDLTVRGTPSFYVLPEIGILLIMIIVPITFGKPIYRKRLIQGGYPIKE
ncbi:ABC transporter permease [Ulvibacterium sp.]|uniref:ABC transporter permease n=1 Tax=Ulvibacterium sp. TaxID=2665914 RepID=UPI002631B4D4|nr:ABC transporter permease [Ulvibacterium sp.]